MRVRFLSGYLVLFAAACAEPAGPPKATTIEFIPVNQTGIAGQALSQSPTFVVKDQSGHPLAGVSTTVSISAGGGRLDGAPGVTAAGPTSIGTWTLGPKVGTNTVSVAAQGLSPVQLTIESAPGLPARFSAAVTTLPGMVGALVGPGPSATLVDANDNPIPSKPVTITVTGGGQAASTMSTDGIGQIAVTNWTLGTIKGMNTLTMTSGSASLTFSAMAAAGVPASFTVISGNGQSALAGTTVSAIRFKLADQYGNGIERQSTSFSVQSGGGSLAFSGTTTDADGVVSLTGWKLGRSASAQSLVASAGGFTAAASAVVQTGYNIQIRFFGPAMSASQQALFTAAAARIGGVIVGDQPDVLFTNVDVGSGCGVPGVAPLNEVVDDLVIYAAVAPIDGPGKILAQAGPCYVRTTGSSLPVVGRMLFDVDDLAEMTGNGSLQDVITHEMLHVTGIGSLYWRANGLLINEGLSSVANVGAQAKQGCVQAGGAGTCASSVPVENTGGGGTAGSHWRESVFDTELMTGYSDAGQSPFSLMTVGGLADIGYAVNANAADPFLLGTSSSRSKELRSPNEGPWEQGLPLTPMGIGRDGKPVVLH